MTPVHMLLSLGEVDAKNRGAAATKARTPHIINRTIDTKDEALIATTYSRRLL